MYVQINHKFTIEYKISKNVTMCIFPNIFNIYGGIGSENVFIKKVKVHFTQTLWHMLENRYTHSLNPLYHLKHL